MAKYCNKCGAELKEDDRFCFRCGAPRVKESPANPPRSSETVRREERPVNKVGQTFSYTYSDIPFQPINNPIGTNAYEDTLPQIEQDILLPDEGGELVIDLSAPTAQLGKSLSSFGPKTWSGSVIGSLFGGLGSLLTGIFKLFRNARVLIFTAVISLLWIWLGQQKAAGNVSELTEILSRLTYAVRGNGAVETVGCALGKGIVGAGLCSVLYGGIGKLFRGIKNIFVQPGFNIGAALIGFSLAAIVYQFTAGFSGKDGLMVGAMGGVDFT